MSARLAALLLPALLAPAVAAAGVRPVRGGELRVLLPATPALDPVRAETPSDLAVARALQATLLDDDRGNLRPALLAEVPEPEEGGRAFTLRLVPGMRFHDGHPVLAADVACSLARLAGPGSRHAWLAAPIEGAAAVRAGRAQALAGAHVVDDHTLRLALAYPFPAFPQALAALPAAVVRCGTPPARGAAGPFRLGSSGEGGLRLEAFDGAYGGRPFLDAVVLAAADARRAGRSLARGAADVAVRPEALDAPRRLEVPPLGILVAVVSQRLGAAAEATRAALAALDRADLARFVRGPVTPLAGLLPPPVPGPRAPRPPPARAPPGLPAQLRLLLPDVADAPRAAADRLQVKLYDAGVRAALELAPPQAFAARVAAGDFEVALVPVWLVSRAPALALAQVVAAVAGPERGAAALAQAAGGDPAATAALAAALEHDLAVVPLYATGLRVGARDDALGLTLRADGTLDLGCAWRFPSEERGP